MTPQEPKLSAGTAAGAEAAGLTHSAHAVGGLATGLSFVLWGVLPIYWKALKDSAEAVEIIAHRIVWSLAFTAILVTWRRAWGEVLRAAKSWRSAGLLLLSAALLSSNWLIYVYGVNIGKILDTSLGYFLTPLVNVALGVIFLRERLRRAQIAAFVLAGGGLAYLILANFIAGKAGFPWIAILLAVTFAFYGLMRKTAATESLPGLTAETATLTLPALVYMGVLAWEGGGAIGRTSWQTHALLAGTGAVTAVPLLLFAFGARRVKMATVGILQYLSPSLTFVLGVFVYDEPMDRARLVAFVLIWTALAIYAVEGVLRGRRRT